MPMTRDQVIPKPRDLVYYRGVHRGMPFGTRSHVEIYQGRGGQARRLTWLDYTDLKALSSEATRTTSVEVGERGVSGRYEPTADSELSETDSLGARRKLN